jgi:hypothetical protein
MFFCIQRMGARVFSFSNLRICITMTGGVSADVEGWTGSTDEDSGVAAILSVSIALPGELGCSSACPNSY